MEQHRATLEQVGTPYPEEWKDWLDWFATLPLFLDLGDLRAVHASWDVAAVNAFRPISRIDEVTLRAMTDKANPLKEYKEHLLNGVEFKLPKGYFFSDKAGFKRKDIRTRWWEPLAGKTYRQAVFPDSETVPDFPIPADFTTSDLAYASGEPPVFFGHYWMPAETAKEPLAPNVAVMDFSVAKGGDMAAYRWEGESVLTADKFMSVPNQLKSTV